MATAPSYSLRTSGIARSRSRLLSGLLATVVALILLGGCTLGGGVNPDGSSPQNIKQDTRTAAVTSTADANVFGWCTFTTRAVISGSNVSLHATVACELYGLSQVEANQLAQGVPCSGRLDAFYYPGSATSPNQLTDQTVNYPNSTCYETGEAHPASTYACNATNCSGRWDLQSQFGLQFPPQYVFALQNEATDYSDLQNGYCRVGGTAPELQNVFQCYLLFKSVTK
jgi:hypothetical protein